MFKKYITLTITLACLLQNSLSDAYQKPAAISLEKWNEIQPLLLPQDHPLTPKLDKFFAKKRIVENIKTLERAKFHFLRSWWIDIMVAKHPKFPGYVFKIYPDEVTDVDELQKFERRIGGALTTQKAIIDLSFQQYFKVPRKWLYPLPDSPDEGTVSRKHFILIAEDMDLANPAANRTHWKSSKITKQTLDMLFTILQTVGLYDCIYVHNVPFSLDGKICFIDTDHFNKWPIKYEKLTSSFSKSNQKYWKKLMKTVGQ